MRTLLVLALGLAVAVAAPSTPQKIVGGSVTNINNYRYAAALLILRQGAYVQACGGTVLNNRSILTAAHCTHGSSLNAWRSRVGSTYGGSGGTVFTSARYINHPNYNARTTDNDIGLIRVNGNLLSNTVVRVGHIAGANYNLGDNQVVWAIGWGATSFGGWASNQLRHVQIWTINQNTCRQRYSELGRAITANMLCSGWLDVGGRDQCQGDSGGPLIHNNVVVGVCSWGEQCALPRYPGVNARVSRFTSWITSNT